MRPTNPMAQLEQWKKNNVLKIEPVNIPENTGAFTKKLVSENLQLESRRATKKETLAKPLPSPLSFQYAQITRQFRHIQDSNRKCLDVYPDEFHHKLKFKAEITNLIERLKGGGKLFNALAKAQGVTFMTDNQSILRDFNQANSYLIFKFGELVEQIERLNLERLENQRLSTIEE